MNNVPWLTALEVLPLVGSLIVVLLPSARAALAKQVTLVVALATVVLFALMAMQFSTADAGALQFAQSVPWIPAFGISYSVGIDGIALVLIGLAVVLTPVVVIAGWRDVEDDAEHVTGSVKGYFALILVLEAFTVGVFAATDLFLFYVLFELVLIPIYFMIGRYGGPQRGYAAIKFLLYSLVGGLFMLVALIALYVVSANATGQGTFDFVKLVQLDIDPTTQKWLFLGLFLAFAVKAPMWPFHTWLPDAAGQAKVGTSVLLIGVLDKLGTFGMIRYCLPLFPDASTFFAPFIVVLALIGVFYGAFVALGQNDMRRLFAYSSMSHFGFIILGIFVFTSIGQSGSMVYMVAHGLSTAGMFLAAGYLMRRHGGSSLISDYEGVNKKAPILAGFFLFASLASLALPGLVSFIGEFLVLLGSFQRNVLVGVIGTLGIVITAAYVLRVYQRSMTGPLKPGLEGLTDLNAREIVALVPVLVLTLFLGLYPAPILNVVNPAVDTVMQVVGAENPTPTLSTNAAAEGGQQ